MWAFFISFFCVVTRRLDIGKEKRLGKVISCFAGIGCGELGLKKQNIAVDSMYAYEVDKYAESVNRYHNPDTVFLGDITKWKEHTETIGRDVDLIMGGSPCQDLSIAGKRAGLDGARSGLFWIFVEMIKHYKPKYFLLENVASMSSENRKIISDIMGVEPIGINAALVSAQQRKRLFWTNLPYTELIQKHISVNDILETVGDLPSHLQSTLNNTDIDYRGAINSDLYIHHKKWVVRKINSDVDYSGPVRIGEIFNTNGSKILKSQGNRIYDLNGKSPALSTKGSEGIYYFPNRNMISVLSIKETERLQTLPDDYTKFGMFSNGIQEICLTQRKKMVGNGWCVDAVAEAFFKNI